jgi:hypothetical protein
MVWLIGGPPRCGKTTLASRIAEKRRIPYFSIDHVASVITPYIPVDQQDMSFPLKATRRQFNDNNDRFFSKYSPDEVVDLYVAQAKTCWPGVKNFIRYAVSDEHELILEGWQILPSLLQELISSVGKRSLEINFLVKTDCQAIISGLKANNPKNDWVLTNTKEENTLPLIAKMISVFGKRVEEEAYKFGFKVINLDIGFSEKISATIVSI